MHRICTIVAAGLLAGAAAVFGPAPAPAASCGLSLDDSNATINTVGGADSDGSIARVACGPAAVATDANSTAVGAGAQATGVSSTVVGHSAEAAASNSSAFGRLARAAGANSTAVGYTAGNTGGTAQGYTALGARAGQGQVLGAFSTTIGGSNTDLRNPRATGDFSVAIGGGTDGNPGAVAGGANGNNHTIAIGAGAQAGVGPGGRTGAVAVGRNARANAVGAAATGQGSGALGNSAAAYGRESRAEGKHSVALGHKAKATRPGAVAIGGNSVANVANTVSVGKVGSPRRIMRVARGRNGTDAVNLNQVKALIKAARTAAAAPPADRDTRRELAELRELVIRQQATLARQQRRIADLEARDTLAALTD